MLGIRKLAVLIAAAGLTVAGCAELTEFNDWLNEPMSPEAIAHRDAQRASQPYIPNYTTIGTPYDTGASGTSGASSRPSSDSGVSSGTGQCRAGLAPAPCRFPDGSWGTCCANPQ
ncbi:hypothetical protein GCM10009116_00030 [Brevundimonas basaltis]